MALREECVVLAGAMGARRVGCALVAAWVVAGCVPAKVDLATGLRLLGERPLPAPLLGASTPSPAPEASSTPTPAPSTQPTPTPAPSAPTASPPVAASPSPSTAPPSPVATPVPNYSFNVPFGYRPSTKTFELQRQAEVDVLYEDLSHATGPVYVGIVTVNDPRFLADGVVTQTEPTMEVNGEAALLAIFGPTMGKDAVEVDSRRVAMSNIIGNKLTMRYRDGDGKLMLLDIAGVLYEKKFYAFFMLAPDARFESPGFAEYYIGSTRDSFQLKGTSTYPE